MYLEQVIQTLQQVETWMLRERSSHTKDQAIAAFITGLKAFSTSLAW